MECPRLIEVALPIREISAESVREKSIRHGHLSTLHLWWARRPLAACRAIVFASLVPDPDDGECPPEFRDAVTRLLKDTVPSVLQMYGSGRNALRDVDPYRPYDELDDTPRNRLLTFIGKWSRPWLDFERGVSSNQPPVRERLDDRSLVKWETSDPSNPRGQEILRIARELVRAAHGGDVPTVLDPFAGGGSIPLESSRLGCTVIANDYNPVAHLILRATCGIPQRYGRPGLRKDANGREQPVGNVLVHDIDRWMRWILGRASDRIGELYPTGEDGHPIIGYLWARTAPCSNPTCRAEMPLLRTLFLANRPTKKVALALEVTGREVAFSLARGRAIQRTDGTMRKRGGCTCPVCGQVTPVEHLRRAGVEGRMGERIVAVITDTPDGKRYRNVEATDLAAYSAAVEKARGVERPAEFILPEVSGSDTPVAHRGQFTTFVYGMETWGKLFNDRQLVAVQTLVGCWHDACAQMEREAVPKKYREAVGICLALCVSRATAFLTNIGKYHITGEKIDSPFSVQGLPMKWDYPEANPFSGKTGSAGNQVQWVLRYIQRESSGDSGHVEFSRGDAASLNQPDGVSQVVVTDPPYFDAMAYADLSDFFYVWLKRMLQGQEPRIFSTPLTPKSEEATALQHRHGGSRSRAREHFASKLLACLEEAKRVCDERGVVSVMFAHQTTEAWTALIEALLRAGLSITSTYPIATELSNRSNALGTMALASSITVTCRHREAGSVGAYRAVRQEIDESVAQAVTRYFGYGMRGADLVVACYGPAVGVFGKYERVERADGTPLQVPELLDLAREAALKAIAGEFRGDNLSRLYFVWANLYGTGEGEWDDARLVVQMSSPTDDAMDVSRRKHLFVVNGSQCRLALLADRLGQSNLGDGEDAPLIDQLHRAMQLWRQEERSDLVAFLRRRDLLDSSPFWQLAQALFEVLPRDEEDRKLIGALLTERQSLRLEARRTAEPLLFDL